MACFYVRVTDKGDIRYESKAQIYEAFLKDTSELADNSIYSSVEVVESVKSAIKMASNYDKYNKSEFDSIYDLITKPHTELFGNIQALKGQSRLTPEFIEDNWIVEYVQNNIGVYTKTGEYDEKHLELVKRDSQLSQVPEEDILPVLTELKSILDIQEATKEFSNKMGRWFQMLIHNDGNFEIDFTNFFNENPQIFGDKVEVEV